MPALKCIIACIRHHSFEESHNGTHSLLSNVFKLRIENLSEIYYSQNHGFAAVWKQQVASTLLPSYEFKDWPSADGVAKRQVIILSQLLQHSFDQKPKQPSKVSLFNLTNVRNHTRVVNILTIRKCFKDWISWVIPVNHTICLCKRGNASAPLLVFFNVWIHECLYMSPSVHREQRMSC